MENLSQPKATLTVKVMENGTIVGTNDPVCLEFEDCVNAVDGLVHWMASVLAEVNDADMEKIGSDLLIAALNQWTFDEHIDEDDEDDDFDEDDEAADPSGPPPGMVN
jgi:hypothetical protein